MEDDARLDAPGGEVRAQELGGLLALAVPRERRPREAERAPGGSVRG